LGGSDETVELPCEVLLAALPEEYRGPVWKDHDFPAVSLHFPRSDLLECLKYGRITYEVNGLAAAIPAGWVAERPSGAEVQLDLSPVMRLTTPKPAESTPGAEQPTAPGPQETWQGIEDGFCVGPYAVDLNTAGPEDLQRLPTVGPQRAAAIIADREARGPFGNVFDLARMKGIVGAREFEHITGLSLKTRHNRREVLNELLGFDPDATPTLIDIVGASLAAIPAVGCVLAAGDGMPLASAGLPMDQASRYAAMMPHYFRRTRTYTKRLFAQQVDCVVMPSADPPCLVVRKSGFHIAVVFNPSNSLDTVVHQSQRLMDEIGWMLGPRAIVR